MTITRLGASGRARCGGILDGDRVQGTSALRCYRSHAAIPVKANVQLFAVPVGDVPFCISPTARPFRRTPAIHFGFGSL
jgi:hypothetical protein